VPKVSWNAVGFFLFVSLLNYVHFVVWVVSWLCLAHLGSDWEGLSVGMVGRVEKGSWGEEERN